MDNEHRIATSWILVKAEVKDEEIVLIIQKDFWGQCWCFQINDVVS